MFSWQDKLINLSNENDHETQQAVPKQFQSLVISSPGRYHILLSRSSDPYSKAQILELIKEEYGLDQLQPQQPMQHQIPLNLQPGEDLKYVFQECKIVLGGDVKGFKEVKGIGAIQGFRSVINDGNTLVHHFWDHNFQYVLLHEVKY